MGSMKGGNDESGALDATQAPRSIPDTVVPPVVVRAGGKDDYQDLRPIDPQHYVVGKEIARGGMGRILTARDRRLGRPVAIKELLDASGDLRARFEREARITAKLQHPSIVNILEAGAWASHHPSRSEPRETAPSPPLSGEPFYVMKLVTGESLDHVIAARASLEARLALLPNVIATVDALAYAHRHRIIHRDLKPANVLVGEFGETVVIDWGLAKDLSDASGDAPELAVGPYRATAAGPGATVVGSVMGTPAYMPSEQARGDVVDERADVYALGAMLYHVLAGAPPYTGTSTDVILHAVIAGPPPPLAARASGVPPDLVTIVDKAMAHDAADRYPSAAQLADDLKKFQTGQLVGAHHYSSWQLLRRWLRRHRTPVAVAVVAATILAVVGVASIRRIVREQARAKAQKTLADASRAEAEELLGFMLVDLRAKLEPVGRLDLLEDVAKKATAYYDRRGDDLTNDELAKRARARRNLGEVLARQGHADEALREYRASLAIYESLVANEPANATWRYDLAAGHDKVGDVVFNQGDAPGALAEYQAARAIREALVTEDPAHGRRRQALAVSHDKIGNVLVKQGDTAAALVEYRAALAIRAELAKEDPANLERQRDLSVSYDKIGNMLLQQGDAAGALTNYRAGMAIAAAMAAQDPANTEHQRDLSISHGKIGKVLLKQGDSKGALAEFRAAHAINKALAERDSTNADWQRSLSFSHTKIGNTLFEQGDLEGALVEYRASMTIGKALAAKDPTNADRQEDLSVNHAKVGNVLLEQGDAAGAMIEYRASLAIRETLAAKDRTDTERQMDLAFAHESVGDALLAQRDAAGALAEYRKRMAITRALAAEDPNDAERQRELASSHIKVGDVLLEQGDAAGALTEYRPSLAINAALANKDPSSAVRLADLAASHERVGDALLALSDEVGALVEYRASLAIHETLAAKDPSNANWQKNLALAREKLATCCGAKGTKRPR